MKLDVIDRAIVDLAGKGNNILEISKTLGMAYNSTHERVKKLEEKGIIKRVRQIDKQCMPNRIEVLK